MIFDKGRTYAIDYTNWKGVRRLRRVIYVDTWYGVCRFHSPTPDVYLVVKIGSGFHNLRFFDTSRIHSVTRDESEYARPEENPLDQPSTCTTTFELARSPCGNPCQQPYVHEPGNTRPIKNWLDG